MHPDFPAVFSIPRIVLQQNRKKIGGPGSVSATYILGAPWTLSAVYVIVVAVVEFFGGA